MSAATNSLLGKWRSLSMLMKIIVINIVVFLTLRIIGVIAMIAGSGIQPELDFLMLPGHAGALLHRPWTALTYMWTHYEIWHAVFNMLWLYWFGSIFMFSSTPKQLLALYLYGGLGGAAAYLSAATFLPAVAGSGLIGASAAVIAIVIATAIINPDFPVRLLFLGTLKLKWVAIITIAIFTIGLTGNNAGGEVAHMGGAVIGVLYGVAMRRGIDITRPFNRAIDAAVTFFQSLRMPSFKRARKPAASYRSSASSQRPATPTDNSARDQAELDKILDKIKKSGYASLTADEKRRLFDVSKRI